jgi:hypothetical protein
MCLRGLGNGAAKNAYIGRRERARKQPEFQITGSPAARSTDLSFVAKGFAFPITAISRDDGDTER